MSTLQRVIREQIYIAKRKKIQKKNRRGSNTIAMSIVEVSSIRKIVGIAFILLGIILIVVKCSGNGEEEDKKPVKNVSTNIEVNKKENTDEVNKNTVKDSNMDNTIKVNTNAVESALVSGTEKVEKPKVQSAEEDYIEYVQDFRISNDSIKKIWKYSTRYKQPFAENLTLWTLETFKGTKEKDIYKMIRKNFLKDQLSEADLYKQTLAIYEQFIYDLKYFPIPKGEKYSFEDSWKTSRNYKGERKHYGTDIMPVNGTLGEIKVISISNGIVENVGWNELGGYRVGIRSEGGAYFYYAHLYEMPTHLKRGDVINAGELIGKMGDTGYGIEGTRGKFPMHLHFGISVMMGENKEVWINPYSILKYLESKKVNARNV